MYSFERVLLFLEVKYQFSIPLRFSSHNVHPHASSCNYKTGQHDKRMQSNFFFKQLLLIR